MGLGFGTALATTGAWLVGREVGNYAAINTAHWTGLAAYNTVAGVGQGALGAVGGWLAAPIANLAYLEAGGAAAAGGLAGPVGLAVGTAVQLGAAYALPKVAAQVYDLGMNAIYGNENAGEAPAAPAA